MTKPTTTNRSTSADYVTAFATGWPDKQPDIMVLSLTTQKGVHDFAVSVVDQGGAIVGQWSETSRGITGSLQGRGGGGTLQVTAVTAGFNANILLKTAGNKQSVSIRADNVFKAANISLSK